MSCVRFIATEVLIRPGIRGSQPYVGVRVEVVVKSLDLEPDCLHLNPGSATESGDLSRCVLIYKIGLKMELTSRS